MKCNIKYLATTLLFLTSCSTIDSFISTQTISELNARSAIDSQYKIETCEHLSESLVMQKNSECFDMLSTIKDDLNNWQSVYYDYTLPNNDKKLIVATKLVADVDTYYNCKITNKLNVKNFKDSNISSYYKEVMRICHKASLGQLMTELVPDNMNFQYNQASNFIQQNKKAKQNFDKLISNMDSDPILKKFKIAAPEFIMTNIEFLGVSCPLVYYVSGLSVMGMFDSTFAEANNYSFSKPSNDKLKIAVGGWYSIVLRKDGNTVIPVSMTDKNYKNKNKKITSTNTMAIYNHMMEACGIGRGTL